MLQNAAVRGPVATSNVAAFMALTNTLVNRNPNAPGLGVFYGPSGYGKTYASIFAQNRTRAIRVEVGDCWTRKTLLKAILAEAGQSGKGTIADLADAVIRLLGDDPSRPLIVDEADRLVSRGMLELVRDIGDKSTAPILLIGEENLPNNLVNYERVHNRVLDWVAAQPTDLDDARDLAASLCTGIEISDDLLAEIVSRSDGRARRIVVNLIKVAEIARASGHRSMTRAQWGDQPFFESRPPQARNLNIYAGSK